MKIIVGVMLAVTLTALGATRTMNSGGFVPYRDSPSTYADSAIRYDDFTSSKAVQFFNYSFSDQQRFSLNTGTPFEINANDAQPGNIVMGDVQNNFDGARVVIQGVNGIIVFEGNAYLPLLPNCAQLATDVNGKIICAP